MRPEERLSRMPKDTISILDGSTFLVSDLRGDVEASPDQPHGFFYRDTRFLSRWRLRANGEPLDALSTDDLAYFAAQFFLVPPTGDVNTNPTVSVIRSSPQAWATGTPLLLLRVLLGLEPDGEELAVDPHFPDGIERVTLEGIPGRWGRADAAGTRMEEALA
jgi:glycogen debranching enzyme